MRLFLVLAGFFIAASARAKMNCQISLDTPQNPGSYDVEVASYDLLNQDRAETKYIYFKPNGTTARFTGAQIAKKTNFGDVDRSKFITLRLVGEQAVEIVYGNVDVRRKDVRKLETLVSAQNRFWVIVGEHYSVLCEPLS